MIRTYGLAKAIVLPWLKFWFRCHFEGLENIPKDGPAIVAFNHIAFLDPFAAAYAVDKAGRRPRFLGKSELFQDKRVGWILRGAGQIEVKRGTREAPMALDHAVAALSRGEVVVVFPEGTITTDRDLNPMAPKTGMARMALEAGVPVIPAAVWGTANIWPKGYKKHMWPPRQDVLVRVGTPMTVRGDHRNRDDWTRVGAEVMEEIGILLASLRPAVPDRRRPQRGAAA
ncbi:MAG: 1-acyl-sn-glycerol-3-phosphate acyltransferase [Actinobacteria bacterium]|nr:1-acyl-sn-glycerol-3-phosphate acyltransferase [Actinomycetota bacterium]